MSAVPVLMYHDVSPRAAPSFRKYVVTPAAFAAQMRWLVLAGYTPVSLAALVRHRAGDAALPARPVLVTFDDGFRDCLEHAVPVLRARRFPATFFVVAGLVGRTSVWLRAERGIELPLADWNVLRGLEQAGCACESHTVSHPRLVRLAPEACAEELRRSREILEDGLGRAVRHLAYPFGAHDGRVAAQAAEAGYVSACSVRPALVEPHDDLLRLPRVPVGGEESLLDFACRLWKGRTARELLRAGVTRARHRLMLGRAA